MASVLPELLFALPFYVLCALGVALVAAWRRGGSPPWRRWRHGLAVAFVATFLVGAPAFSHGVIRRIEQRYAPPAVRESDRHPDNLIIVLTAGWFRLDDGRSEIRLSEDGWERLDAGVKLWRRIGGTLLITGAPAPDGSGASIAAGMADVARALGVPETAIIVEPHAWNTYENFTLSTKWLGEHRDHLWLVTSALHLPRAMAVAARLGFAPVPYPCFYRGHGRARLKDWLPSNQGPAQFDDAMHEVLGMWVYRWRGWVN